MPFDSIPERPDVPFGAANLLRLADTLEKLPDEQYDHSVWSDDDVCGTTACAMGWAGITGMFGFTHEQETARFQRANGSKADPLVLAMETFEISERVASYLFVMAYYAGVNEDDPDWPAVSQLSAYVETRQGVIHALRRIAEHKIATAKAAALEPVG